jgi:hypothetical protein
MNHKLLLARIIGFTCGEPLMKHSVQNFYIPQNFSTVFFSPSASIWLHSEQKFFLAVQNDERHLAKFYCSICSELVSIHSKTSFSLYKIQRPHYEVLKVSCFSLFYFFLSSNQTTFGTHSLIQQSYILDGMLHERFSTRKPDYSGQ